MDNVAHHPNRLVERAEFVISVDSQKDNHLQDEVKANMSCIRVNIQDIF